jgi:hypothetical protein
MIVVLAFLFCFGMAQDAAAGTGGSTIPNYPDDPYMVGDVVNATFSVVNNSDGDEKCDEVTISSLIHTPSCGVAAGDGVCPQIDGVFEIIGECLDGPGGTGSGTSCLDAADCTIPGELCFKEGIGQTGTGCEGQPFDIIGTGTVGEYEFRPRGFTLELFSALCPLDL